MGEARERASSYVLTAIAVLASAAFVVVLWPFLEPVIFAAFIAILTKPAHDHLTNMLRRRGRLAALLVSVGALLVILIPLALLAVFGARELLDLAQSARQVILLGVEQERPLGRLLARLQIGAAEIQRLLVAGAERAAGAVTGLFATTGELALDAFLLFVATYYFLVDGRRLLREAIRLVPLDERYERELFKGFVDATHGIVYGNVVTALLQGVTGGLGFLIFGVGKPLLWGTAMAVASFVPVVGTALVWVPMSVWLVATSHPVRGLSLAAYGVLVIGSVDNVARPFLVRGRLRMHPLLAFLSVFGGLSVFGLPGLFLGPLVVAFFLAVLRIYSREFVPT